MKWISVKDRLPEIEKEYLVYGNTTGSGVMIDIATFYNGKFEKWNQPAHWMPLPDPPPCNCGFSHDENYNP